MRNLTLRNLILFVVGCVMILALSATGLSQKRQEIVKCALTLERLPVVRGLKLGLTSSEIQKLFTEETKTNESQDLARLRLGIGAVNTDDIGVGSQSRERIHAYALSFRFITMPSSFSASSFSNSRSPLPVT